MPVLIRIMNERDLSAPGKDLKPTTVYRFLHFTLTLIQSFLRTPIDFLFDSPDKLSILFQSFLYVIQIARQLILRYAGQLIFEGSTVFLKVG